MDRWKIISIHGTTRCGLSADYTEYARFLDRASKTDAARWLNGDTIARADKRSLCGHNYIYSLTTRVRRRQIPTIHRAQRDRASLLKGGLRLAGLLNKSSTREQMSAQAKSRAWCSALPPDARQVSDLPASNSSSWPDQLRS